MNGDAAGPGTGRVDLEEALDAFAGHLREVKGSSRSTVEVYVRHVRPFVALLTGAEGSVDLHDLSAARVRSYVTALGGRYAPQTLKLIATALRAFLGFAWVSGWTCSDLHDAVGPVVTHRSGRLPRALEPQDVRRLLASPDQGTTTGARDYAMLLLLSRLGLRAGEVASLQLDDIDWAAATLSVVVKGGGRRTFPIPQDVGQALVAHLRRRPAQGGGIREERGDVAEQDTRLREVGDVPDVAPQVVGVSVDHRFRPCLRGRGGCEREPVALVEPDGPLVAFVDPAFRSFERSAPSPAPASPTSVGSSVSAPSSPVAVRAAFSSSLRRTAR